MKILATKMNMTQVWKDNLVIPVSPLKLEDVSKMEELKEGEEIKVRGISKGKGFSGVVKRHGFHGGPKTHGQKNRQRAPGSIGSTAPQRVLPGRRMAGRGGGAKTTLRGSRVISLNKDNGIVMVSGSVPGNVGGKIEIIKI